MSGELNYYGQPIIAPEHFDGEHYAAMVPVAAGMPPACSCGWTRHTVDGVTFELADHLRDMRETGARVRVGAPGGLPS
jgi:hypothetical protein